MLTGCIETNAEADPWTLNDGTTARTLWFAAVRF